MPITLPASPPDGRLFTVRNTSTSVVAVDVAGGGMIDGETQRYLTPGSLANYQWFSQQSMYFTMGGVFRPMNFENDITTPVIIGTDTQLTTWDVPAPGLFTCTGLLPFEWTGGNNQDFTGSVAFKISGVPVTEEVLFGNGRASTSADWPLTLAFFINNDDGSITGQTVSVTASNLGQGAITLESPAYVDFQGPA